MLFVCLVVFVWQRAVLISLDSSSMGIATSNDTVPPDMCLHANTMRDVEKSFKQNDSLDRQEPIP